MNHQLSINRGRRLTDRPVNPSTCLPVNPLTCRPVYPSTYLIFVGPSTCAHVYSSTCLPVSLSTGKPVKLLPVDLNIRPVYQSTSQSVDLFTRRSVNLSMFNPSTCRRVNRRSVNLTTRRHVYPSI